MRLIMAQSFLQCSWGYNSSLANLIEGYTPGPGSEEEWENIVSVGKRCIGLLYQ